MTGHPYPGQRDQEMSAARMSDITQQCPGSVSTHVLGGLGEPELHLHVQG